MTGTTIGDRISPDTRLRPGNSRPSMAIAAAQPVNPPIVTASAETLNESRVEPTQSGSPR